MPETAKKIDVGSAAMREAWEAGVEWYQPTCGTLKLQEEGGTTQRSIENLDLLVDHMGDIQLVRIGPNQGALFIWDSHVSYLATGFSIGYMGEGPSGFAKLLESQDVGDWGEIRHVLSALDPTFEGLLYDRQGKGFFSKHGDL